MKQRREGRMPVITSRAAAAVHPRRRLGLITLAAVMYLTISGGAYGIEDAVRVAGPRLILLLCLIVPLTLSLPTALMAAELTALVPDEGGFYLWVKQAFGPFPAFAEACLTILYAAVDMALYPVLFAAYLSYVVPLPPGGEVVLAIALVWTSGLLNYLGVRQVGGASAALTAILLAPFLLMVAFGLPRLLHFQMPAARAGGANELLAALGGGLTVVIWNFCGWENVSIVAGEIEAPQRNYLRAVWIVLPMVVLGYLLPLMVALSGATDTSQWQTGYFSAVAHELGGRWLGLGLALGGAASAFALFEAGMLWVSRMPFVLAREGYLPPRLAALADRRETPAASIWLCCVVFTILVPLGFTTLVVMDVFFYMAGLVLEVGALLRLRKLRPQRRGLFVIGGGTPVLYAIALLPVLTWIATFGMALGRGAGGGDLLIAALLSLSIAPAYAFCRRRWGGPAPVSAV